MATTLTLRAMPLGPHKAPVVDGRASLLTDPDALAAVTHEARGNRPLGDVRVCLRAGIDARDVDVRRALSAIAGQQHPGGDAASFLEVVAERLYGPAWRDGL